MRALAVVVCLFPFVVGCQSGTEGTETELSTFQATGTVRDLQGVAVQGVSVILLVRLPDGDKTTEAAYTGADGRYTTPVMELFDFECIGPRAVFEVHRYRQVEFVPDCGKHVVDITWDFGE